MRQRLASLAGYFLGMPIRCPTCGGTAAGVADTGYHGVDAILFGDSLVEPFEDHCRCAFPRQGPVRVAVERTDDTVLGKFTGMAAGKDLPDIGGEVDGTDQHGIGLLLLQKANTDFKGPVAAGSLCRNAETRSTGCLHISHSPPL